MEYAVFIKVTDSDFPSVTKRQLHLTAIFTIDDISAGIIGRFPNGYNAGTQVQEQEKNEGDANGTAEPGSYEAKSLFQYAWLRM